MRHAKVGMSYEARHARDQSRREKLPLLRYMLYLLVVTLTVTGVSLSRYSTSAVGSDAARAAKWNVEVTHDAWRVDEYNDVSSHAANGSKVYTFTVTNRGEVAVRAWCTAAGAKTITPGGTFDLAPGGSRNVTVEVEGGANGYGKTVNIHVDYVQID